MAQRTHRDLPSSLRHRPRHRHAGALAFSLTAGLAAAWAQSPAQADATGPTHANQPVAAQNLAANSLATGDHIQQMDALADTGQFARLLSALDATPIPGGEADSLRKDLERYRSNEAKRTDDRKNALSESLEKLQKAFDDQRIEDALVAAIDAHSQDENPEFFERTDIQELSVAAREVGDQALLEGQWLKAASIYRLLNLLYEVDSRFSREQKTTSEHLRVLQMYAPKRFQAMADQRIAELEATAKAVRQAEAEANGQTLPADEQEKAERPKIDLERWEDRLTRIDRKVLEHTLNDCVSAHINAPGYRRLLQGGIQQLLIMVRTPEASESFPKLADTAARARFIERLETLSGELERATKLTFQQAKNRISLIEAANKVTVQLPDEVLFYELTQGATDTIDTFTYVIWPADHQEFLDRTLHGKIYGVGIQIELDNFQLTVVSPLGGTPAHRAGLKAGDVIETVNGYATSAWSLKRAVKEITGEEGTAVTLGIRREGEPELLTKKLIRAKIPIESVRGWDHDTEGVWDFWLDQDAGIGYIRMTQFVEETAADLDKAIARMQKDGGINGLVLDLRFNPGGLLQSAVQVVDRFVERGPIVGQVDAEGKHQRGSLFNAQKDNTLPNFPMVVLVNQGSASAAEIVSGALQDLNRATVIGERSYGKGSVQQVGWYPNRFAPKWGVRITTSHYTLPSGRVIHREEDSKAWGVQPHLEVPMTERQVVKAVEYRREVDVLRDAGEEPVPASALLDEGMDPQLEAALLVLKTKILTSHLSLVQGPTHADSVTP